MEFLYNYEKCGYNDKSNECKSQFLSSYILILSIYFFIKQL